MKISVEEIELCPVCGERAGVFFREAPDFWEVVEGRFRYDRCARCSLVYLRTRPAPADMLHCYPAEYLPYGGSDTPGEVSAAVPRPRAVRRVFERGSRWIRRRFPDTSETMVVRSYGGNGGGRTVLDFGCGSTAFLDGARLRGWRTVGVDFNESVVARVRAAGHAAHLQNEPGWHDQYEGSVDVVRMNHVLEHLPDPVTELHSLRRVLRAGGLLHVAVPNVDGFSSRMFRQHWLGLEPRHVVLFSPATLERVLRDAGFTNVELAGETAAKDVARSAQVRLFGRIGYGPPGPSASLVADVVHPLARLATAAGLPDRIHALSSRS